jgi:hypothetical protein
MLIGSNCSVINGVTGCREERGAANDDDDLLAGEHQAVEAEVLLLLIHILGQH